MKIHIKNIHVFLIYASLTLFSGVIAQVVLPLLAPQFFTDGILNYFRDAIIFHKLALTQLSEINSLGWEAFNWKPGNQLPGGILTFFYYLTGISKPFWYIILNTLFVGWTAFIVNEFLQECRIKGRLNLIMVFVLVFTPTSIAWLTQVSKDIFIVFGYVCVGYSLLCIHRRKMVPSIAYLLMGSISIFLFKDYMIEILLMGMTVALFLQMFSKSKRTISFGLNVLAILAVLFFETKLSARYYAQSSQSTENVPAAPARPISSSITEISIPEVAEQPASETEKPTPYSYKKEVPLLDLFLERLSVSNYRFLMDFPHGKENVRHKGFINSTTAALLYIPHALTFGFFEPLPGSSRWEEGKAKGLIFLILQLEMFLAYFSYFIIFRYFLALTKEDKLYVLGNIIVCFGFILVLGFAVPNLGAINRYRYPFLLILKLVAIYVWTHKNPKQNVVTA